MIIKKTDKSAKEEIRESMSDSGLSKNDCLSLMNETYSLNMSLTPDYATIMTELNQYDVGLPEAITMSDLSGINKLYSIAQAYMSRVTALEMLAIDNCNRWERLVNLMDGYVKDRECELLVSEEVQALPNTRTQSAKVRTLLKKELSTLMAIKNLYNEAEGLMRKCTAKKKDLTLVLTNLSRQVKVMGIEYGLTK
jgi:hypothetical protein